MLIGFCHNVVKLSDEYRIEVLLYTERHEDVTKAETRLNKFQPKPESSAVYRFSPYVTDVRDVRSEASVRIRIRIRLSKERTRDVEMTSSVTMPMSHRGVRKRLPHRLEDR